MSVFIPKGRETYYCRITIPFRLWSLVGRKEVWRSLQSNDKALADVRAEQWKASGKRLFLRLKREGYQMNKKTIDDLVQRWLDELLDEEVPWHPRRSEQLSDYEDLLQEQRLDNRWGHMAEPAQDLLKASGLSLRQGDKLFRLLCQRLLEGHIEYTRIQQDRLHGNYRPFNHAQQFLEGDLTLQKAASPAPSPTEPESSKTRPESAGTRPFMEVVRLYFQENVPRSQRSANQIKAEFKRFLKVVGGDLSKTASEQRPIGSITKDDCRKYKEHLLQERKLRLVTVIKWLGMVGAIYRWASRQGFVPENYNPTNGLAPSMKRAKAEVQGYRDYTDEELLAVFSSKEFSKQRMKHPERYWSVLICLLSGTRREEACQLNVCDIQEQEGIPYFNITDTGKGQMLKNDSSRRKVPIHSSLIQLGFVEYINSLRQRGVIRLFPQLTKKNGTYGNSVGHWYTRLIRRVGLADKGLVLHGLRHTVITRLADAGANEKVRRVLVGHAGTDIHDRLYNHSARMSMKLLQEGLEKLQYPAVLQALNHKGEIHARLVGGAALRYSCPE